MCVLAPRTLVNTPIPKRFFSLARAYKEAFVIRFVFVLVTLLASSAFAVEYPLTIVDDLGREVVLTAEPMRVVSVVPSHTETVCALGACDKLVGVDDFSDFPAQVTALPQLGGGLSGTDIEAIVGLEPDLVLASEYGELATTLEQLGLTVYAGSPQTFAEALEEFGVVGQLVNREAEAEALRTEVVADIDAISASVAAYDAPQVYYEIDSTPYSVGPNSFVGVLIQRAGGENIVPAELGDFPQLEPEFIVFADPDIIILSNGPSVSPEEVAERPGWSAISAVVEGEVHALTQEQVGIINRPGPRMADAVRILATLLHADSL